MKVGIYSDAHFSVSSSILTRTNGSRFSVRLDSLVESMKWMYELFEKENVNLIVNCGDLTDSDVLQPEVNTALAEALSYNYSTKELYIIGNHEIKSKDNSLYSTSLLDGYPNIEIFTKVTDYKVDDHTRFLLVPFISDKNQYNEVYSILSNSDPKDKYFVFSHMSYIGENYNNYIETEGLDKIILTSHENLQSIFNGHIHNVKDSSKPYVQVGSLVGNSFGDSYSEGYPRVIILDTETNQYQSYINPHAILYYKLSATSIRSLSASLSKLSKDHGKCIRVEVPSSIKDDVYEYIEQNKDKYQIVEYRIKAKYESTDSAPIEIESLSHYSSPYEALKDFTESQSELPYPVEDMMQFLNMYVGV